MTSGCGNRREHGAQQRCAGGVRSCPITWQATCSPSFPSAQGVAQNAESKAFKSAARSASRDWHSSVEDLLPLLATHKEGIAVTRQEELIGVVTASSVISALAHQASTAACASTTTSETTP